MLMKTCSKITTFLLTIALLVPVAFAAPLDLTFFGTLSVDNPGSGFQLFGNQENPVIQGVGTAGQSVTVNINNINYTTDVAADETWSVNTSLPYGEYTLTITSGSETITHPISTGAGFVEAETDPGSPPPGSGGSVNPAVPDTGNEQVLAIALSVAMLGMGMYLVRSNKGMKKAYEKRITKDL